jgi:DNA-directed RNA polymerase subunit RPC12/RpoP
MGNMGNMGGPAPSFQMKCQNCKQDVTLGPAAQKIKCPRCGCGVFIDMQNPSRMGQPTQDPKQYTEGSKQHTDFSVIRPVSPTGEIP